jgi:dTDP-3-amino-3,4,6-trideoxy-alpha-D-glucose transaminase
MDELQGAILRVKLRHLDGWNARRGSIAATYARELVGVTLVAVTPGGESVHHLFPVLVARRDDFQRALAARGVETIVHYPTPLHLVPSYRGWGFGEGAFPVAEDAARRVLSLPIFPQLTDDEVRTVVAAVREAHA